MAGQTTEQLSPCAGAGDEPPCGCDAVSVLDLVLDADDVAAIRFGPDPVWETVASLGVLAHPRRHQLHRALVDRVREPRWDHGLLMALMSSEKWYPSILAPVPQRAAVEPTQALAAVAGGDDEVAEGDLEVLRTTQPRERRWLRTTPAQLREETAAALASYWSGVLAPLWERVSDITNADIAYRSRTLAAEGVGATLTGLHDRLSYREGRLRLEMPGHHEHRRAGGAGVRFVPSVFRWPCLVAEPGSAPPVVSYAARGSGLLWESAASREAPGLDPVLGRCGWRSWRTSTPVAAEVHGGGG